MRDTDNGGAATRDQLAIEIMFMALEKDWGLFRDPKYLAAQCYRVTDAMIESRKETE